MLKFTSPLLRTVALAALVGSFSFAPFAHAQDSDSMSDQSPASGDSAPAPAKPHGGMKHDGMKNVETRIKTLHDKLMITADQENDWNAVAQTMRDNEAAMAQMIQQRHENAESMTAVDDLQSYQQMMQSHADGLQKMIATFKPLYAEMSDDQKKNADMVFGHFEGRGMMHHKHKQHS